MARAIRQVGDNRQREPGSLWFVRLGAGWEVARWQQEEDISWWEIIGSEEGIEPDHWREIGPRIRSPGEVSEDAVERVARAIEPASFVYTGDAAYDCVMRRAAFTKARAAIRTLLREQ